MATHMLYILKSYFSFIYESFPAGFLHRMMMKVCSFIWVLLCNFVSSSFRHLIEHLAGSRVDDVHEKGVCPLAGFNDQEDKKVPIFDGFDEDENLKSEFTFGFKFQMKEEDLIAYKDTHDSKSEETEDVVNVLMNTSKYQFVSVQDFGGFVEEPKPGSFTVHEMFVEPPLLDDNFIIKEKGKSHTLGEKEVRDEQKDVSESFNFLSDEKVNDFTEKDVSLGPILQRVDVSSTDSVTDASSCDDVQESQEKKALNLGENGVLRESFDLLKDEKVNDFAEKEVFLGQILQRVDVTDASSCDDVQELQEEQELNFCENGVLRDSFDLFKDENVNDFTEKEVFSGQILQRVDVCNTDSVADASSCDEVQELKEKKKLNLGENGVLRESFDLLKDVKVNDFTEKEVSLGQILQRVDVSSTDSVTDASSCDDVQESQEKEVLNLGENGVLRESFDLFKDEKVNDFTEKEGSLGPILQRVDVTDASSCDDVQESQEKKALNLGENGVLRESFDLLKDEKVNDFTEKEVSLDQILQRVDVCNTDSVADASSCDKLQESQEKKELNSGKNGVLKAEQVNWLGEFIMRNDNLYNDSFDSHDLHSESDDSGEGFFSICPQDIDPAIEPKSETLVPSLVPSFSDELDDDYIELEPSLETEQPNFDSFGNQESDSCFENSLEPEDLIRSWEFDSDEEEDDADVLLEHQELIDQMKTELKNARTGGLPTILEESETPRVEEDYKPLQINEKLEHRDLMAEIQKFYKSYTEKMRKLDVLNYQTLQAINFLRMKHPDQTNAGESTSLSAIKSVLLPSLWPCKLRRIYADPTLKTITELHKDLEIVYVGQACLSWEMLHWQYKKAKELQLYDPQGYRSYNQIAIEFQQFHVLLRRFTEDELFQGPRVQNYTKQRCSLRGFLQVPAIKDDNLKEKKARKKEGEAVSISTMTKMIKESMMAFWEFLHTDKDTTNLFLTIILQGSKAHLQDPADSDLFMEIKTIHQKKERKLKDLLRTGNCIVKKFQKQQETILDQHMFVSQVELRLVSRVLSLPRLSRDQLVWCQSKLNNIKFVDRKIQVEDSLFLLFPC